MKSSVLAVSLAVSLATLGGCAVVPIGPPVYVGARVNTGPYYAQPYYARPYYARPYYGPYWRRW